MTGAKSKTDPAVVVVGSLMLAVFANWLAAYIFGYPFLYCWLLPVAYDLYAAWGIFTLYIVMGLTAIVLLRGKLLIAAACTVACIAIIELPRLSDYIFRAGGSCGA